MATVIMFANQKGGVGKTTSMFEVSYLLSIQKKKVLMLDNDGQVNLTRICGANPEQLVGKTIFDVLMGAAKIDEAIQTVRPNLDILPGNRRMLSQYFVGADDSYLLKEMISIIEDYKKYDFITIDVGPESGQLMTMAMIASDYVIAVSSLGELGYSGVVQMCADLQNNKKRFTDFTIKPLGILLTFSNRTTVSSIYRDSFNELANAFGAPVFKTEISDGCIAEECKALRQSLNEYKHSAKLSKQYRDVTREILERIGGK